MKNTITVIIDTENSTDIEIFIFEGDKIPQELKDFIEDKI